MTKQTKQLRSRIFIFGEEEKKYYAAKLLFITKKKQKKKEKKRNRVELPKELESFEFVLYIKEICKFTVL